MNVATLSPRLAQFERDGFVLIEDAFDPAELAAVNAALREHWRKAVATGDPENYRAAFAHIKCEVLLWWDAHNDNAAIRDLRGHPRLAELTADVLPPGFTDLHTLIAFSLPGGTGQAWHQDCRAKDPTKHNVNRLVYTQDTSREDGAVVCVPGSHRRELPVGGEHDDLPGQQIICPKAGTVLFLHGRCFHRVLPNRSSNLRVSVNFRLKSPGTSDQILQRPVYRHMTLEEREKFNAHLVNDD